jgi:hypothetical protein
MSRGFCLVVTDNTRGGGTGSGQTYGLPTHARFAVSNKTQKHGNSSSSWNWNTQKRTRTTTRTADPMEESTLDALGESLAGNNEWISRGIQVQAHESIDPNSEATEVDLASTIGFPRERSSSATTNGVIVGVSLFSNFVFAFCFRILFSK